MKEKEMMALILAGGKGSRLGSLTNDMPKPAMFYGGDYRMIDFPISNCINSGLKTICVLTQYFSDILHKYIDSLNCTNHVTGVKVLKRSSNEHRLPYMGTADAVYKNIPLIDAAKAKYILVLAGDHVYQMNYSKMLSFHKQSRAAVTIASTPVDWSEASRYGILYSNSSGQVYHFEEKPPYPSHNLASMGVYIFTWKDLKKYLLRDYHQLHSQHDFGRDIIPAMLAGKESVSAYKFEGYWKDTGTVHDLWHSNMDLISSRPALQLNDKDWRLYTSFHNTQAYYYPQHGNIINSLVSKGCRIYGALRNCVVSNSVIIRDGAQVTDSIIMPNVYIGRGVKIHRAIIGANAKILSGITIGAESGTPFFLDQKICQNGISLVAPYTYLNGETSFCKGSHIESTICMDTPFPNPIMRVAQMQHNAE